MGGKNASLGEMLRALKDQGIRVPDGFATMATAYRSFLEANDLESRMREHLDMLKQDNASLQQTGKAIRQLFHSAEFPEHLANDICQAYQQLSQRYDTENVDVAARSSATAEDLPEASFAGQQESFLNVTGEADVLEACRRCYASLFTDRAIKRVREQIGLDNVIVMVPFCRTLAEADKVLDAMAEYGLTRGENNLQVYVMAEIPANIVLADQFAQRFDGFSIGSNDLTQLTLGVDRDSQKLSALFEERDDAVKWMCRHLIQTAHAAGAKVGICGQSPSDYPEFAAFLVEQGIDSISLNPDSVIDVKKRVAEVE